jgi:ribosomal protein S18 acetylase RimI-like enzyme
MSDLAPAPLTPCPIELDSREFKAICDWPFDDPYVGRLLKNDIPRRREFNCCWIWIYRDPPGRLAGFGTLDVCNDCSAFTEGRSHLYIPLLAKNPTIKSLGYGTSILRHLVDEATVIAHQCDWIHDVLFLDVYESNTKAIGLYSKSGFAIVTPEPLLDPDENNKPFVVMAKRISAARPENPC